MADYFENLPKNVKSILESKKGEDRIEFIYSIRKDKTLQQFEKNKIISAFIIHKMNDIGCFRRKGLAFSWRYVDVECGIGETFKITTDDNDLGLRLYIITYYGLNPTEPEYEYLIHEMQGYARTCVF